MEKFSKFVDLALKTSYFDNNKESSYIMIICLKEELYGKRAKNQKAAADIIK